MGIFDRSSSSTSNLTQHYNLPVAIQGDENIVAHGDLYNVSSDHNAIDRATELASRSLDVGETLALEAFDSARFTSESAFTYARDSQSMIAEAYEDSASGARDSFAGALDFARNIQTRFQDTIGSTVDAIQRIGVEQNKSTDQRLAETTEKTFKYAIVGVAVIALAFVLLRSR